MTLPPMSPEAYAAMVRAGYIKDGKVVATTPAQVAVLRMKVWLQQRGRR